MTQIHFKEVLRAIRDDLLCLVEVREPLDLTQSSDLGGLKPLQPAA